MTAAAPEKPAPEEELPTGIRLRLITISLILAPLLQVFDTSIMSIALRQMQGALSVTQDQAAWVLTSYLIAVAVMTPLWGALGGIFGRKPLLLISIAGFMVFSLLSGSSDTLPEMLAYRFVQGAFGAALLPLALSALLSNYKPEDFSIAMGWWGVGIMFGPVFGPTLGGYIAEYWGWRWAFYLNLPICVLAFAMIWFLVPRTRNSKRRKFNYFGFVMLATVIACLQFILDRGERLEWFDSPTIIALSLIGLAAFWVFMVNSLTSSTPFIDPLIFMDRNYLSGVILRILFGVMLFGSLVLIPPFLQNHGGYSMLDSGIIMAPRGIGTMAASLVVGRLAKIIDPRLLIAFGMITTAVCMWLFSNFTNDMDQTTIIMINVVQGVAFAFFVVPVNSVAFSTLPAAQRDVGTAFYSLLNNIGRGIGIALLAGYLARQTQVNHAILSEQITPFNDHFRHLGVPDVWNPATVAGLSALNRMLSQQAELLAYIADYRLLTMIILCSLPVLLFMRDPRRDKKK
jgi:MFS transporter, DHA2 family, multidrug resistance protein